MAVYSNLIPEDRIVNESRTARRLILQEICAATTMDDILLAARALGALKDRLDATVAERDAQFSAAFQYGVVNGR